MRENHTRPNTSTNDDSRDCSEVDIYREPYAPTVANSDMTEVLHVPRQPGGQSYYDSSALRRTPPSSSALFYDTTPPVSRPTSSPKHTIITTTAPIDLPEAVRSPPPAAAPPTDASTETGRKGVAAAHGLNIDTSRPSNSPSDSNTDPADTPLPSPAYSSDVIESPTSETTLSDSSLPTPTVCDDTAVKDPPSRQVDFLTHEWREEDIWSSWRHIVCNRKIYGERSRLENASWRQWGKTKHNLRTIAPETLNWLKESDITWLYGPLKLASSYPISKDRSNPSSSISKNNSFINKKPILKKRSMSEVMLARSISSSSLLREAATTALYSQRRGPRRSDASSEFSESKLPSEVPSRDQPDYFTSRSSSCCDTPSEKKHIRFDDVVEQCIAVDHKDLGLDEDSDDEDRARDYHPDGSSTSSDEDGGLVMKRKPAFATSASASTTDGRPKVGSRRNSYTGRKIIETLPATTLKYRTDSPDITEQAQHHTFGRAWNSSSNSNQSRLSPRASQETLRPSNPSSNFLLPEDDDNEDGDVDDDEAAGDSDSSWSFGANNPKSSLGAGVRGRNSRSMRGNSYDEYDEDQMAGMRRTGSGMFMPYDDDEFGGGAGSGASGLFGRVSETINTARDIAHVIWTVGWRT